VFALENHSARLRTSSAFGFLCNEAHLIADAEFVERLARDAVAVEIDLAAVGAQNKTAILLREKPHDTAVIGHRMHFDLAAPVARIVFELPARRVESVANAGALAAVPTTQAVVHPNCPGCVRLAITDSNPRPYRASR